MIDVRFTWASVLHHHIEIWKYLLVPMKRWLHCKDHLKSQYNFFCRTFVTPFLFEIFSFIVYANSTTCDITLHNDFWNQTILRLQSISQDVADNVSHPRRLDPTIELITYSFVLYLQHGRHDVKCKPSIAHKWGGLILIIAYAHTSSVLTIFHCYMPQNEQSHRHSLNW